MARRQKVSSRVGRSPTGGWPPALAPPGAARARHRGARGGGEPECHWTDEVAHVRPEIARVRLAPSSVRDAILGGQRLLGPHPNEAPGTVRTAVGIVASRFPHSATGDGRGDEALKVLQISRASTTTRSPQRTRRRRVRKAVNASFCGRRFWVAVEAAQRPALFFRRDFDRLVAEQMAAGATTPRPLLSALVLSYCTTHL
jgi:hypothetical protein